jgi:hypothetical protein
MKNRNCEEVMKLLAEVMSSPEPIKEHMYSNGTYTLDKVVDGLQGINFESTEGVLHKNLLQVVVRMELEEENSPELEDHAEQLVFMLNNYDALYEDYSKAEKDIQELSGYKAFIKELLADAQAPTWIHKAAFKAGILGFKNA